MSLSRNRAEQLSTPFDEEVHREEIASPNLEEPLLQKAGHQHLKDALEQLPVEFREALVLPELLPYSTAFH